MNSGTLKHRKGQALVETALVLFVIVLFTFAITEFGRAMYIKNMLNNAARAAVRQAVVTGSLALPKPAYSFVAGSRPTDPIYAKIYDGLMYIPSSDYSYVSANMTGTDSSGNAITGNAMPGNTITVSVTYSNFKPFVKIINISSTLAGQASMRYE